MLTVHAYDGCSTCRSALRWLRERGIAHRVLPIREQPPSLPALRRAAAVHGIRALFNRSGQAYREQGLKNRLPTLSDDAALALLAADGNLVKRPFVTGDDLVLVGFDPEAWAQALR